MVPVFPKAIEMKTKIKQTGPSQTSKLSYIEGNHKWKQQQQQKNTPTDGEKTTANAVTNKGLISKIYTQVTQLSNKNQPNHKMGRRPK